MRDDQRQRIFVLRANVNEVDVYAVDFGQELRGRVQFRLDFAPIVTFGSVARECLGHRQLHALRIVADQLARRPPRRLYSLPQLDKLGLRNA